MLGCMGRRVATGLLPRAVCLLCISVIASACAGIQRLTGGRFRYGVGTGDSSVRLAGVPVATVAQMEEFCLAFRALTNNRTATCNGNELRLEFDADPVPLWLAAEGPRMLDLAGRVADGVIMGNGVSEEVVRDNIARVERGANAAGRSLDDIELWFMAKPYEVGDLIAMLDDALQSRQP